MTAEIAILNTYGVSLAADSAVTLTIGEKEKKIYNSANKVFTLSKYHPVGIMIYNNAQFMNIEWEVIIKEYRRKLEDKSFNTLFEYSEDFIEYLRTLSYVTDEQKELSLTRLIGVSLNKIKNYYLSKMRKTFDELVKMTSEQCDEVLKQCLVEIRELQDNMPDNTCFCLNTEHFLKNRHIFDEVIKIVFEKYPISSENSLVLFDLMIRDIQKSDKFPIYSGIVISGYGEKEIFPSIFSCNIYGAFDNCLIRSVESKNSISVNNKAVIIPFAQSEMVNSFMEGIDPTFENNIQKEITILFDGIKSIIKKSYTNKTDQLQEIFLNSIKEFKRKVYIDPILSIVETLQKSDLAEMAESLVNLTSFKRHVSTEAETVGGPTDVAIITKGDGFIWIKRKHYFDPNLNRHFFENYFRGCKENE